MRLPARLLFEQPKIYIGAYPGVDAYHENNHKEYLDPFLGKALNRETTVRGECGSAFILLMFTLNLKRTIELLVETVDSFCRRPLLILINLYSISLT